MFNFETPMRGRRIVKMMRRDTNQFGRQRQLFVFGDALIMQSLNNAPQL